ncbi:hypothetical protein Patl1_03777 [Pistacia atlantica]|uniref:Uncharacterized protein n=1 Tax=Pistacia atlantica TaxID=434234 RepID=A0ACC1BW66_9ROSI|nr:hypothetical protein Patl1_03777 [Pistacia atlantica]
MSQIRQRIYPPPSSQPPSSSSTDIESQADCCSSTESQPASPPMGKYPHGILLYICT